MKKILLLTILALSLFAFDAKADEVRLSFENDWFGHSDQYYTHGTMFSYSKFNDPYMNLILYKEIVTEQTYSIGQYMYTPNNISIPYLLEDQRPYGGLLYFNLKEKMYSEDYDDRMQTLSYTIGVTGEASGAGGTQRWVHESIGSTMPEGWDYQLNNELVVNVSYADYFQAYVNDYLNWVTYYGATLGNLNIHGNMGLTLKFGYNVSKAYGFTKLEPIPRAFDFKDISLYGFIGVEGRWVLYNALLDGTMFSDSIHTVESKDYLGEFLYGVTAKYHNIELNVTVTLRSEEYYGQTKPTEFGMISLAYNF